MHSRAWGLSVLAVVALLAAGLGGVAAQDGAFADLAGVPEIQITLTDAGLEGVPAETPAGWTLVTFTNAVTPSGDPFEDAWQIEFVKLLDGMVAADLAPPEDASPESEAEDPFAFIYETYLAGGPGARQGETTQGLVYLEAGDYAVNVFGPWAPAPLTVTAGEGAGAPADLGDAIAVDLTITETGTSGTFDFAAEAGDFAGGPAVVAIVNESDQPHFIFSAHSTAPITEEQVMALLMAEEGGTPPAGAPDPSTISPGFNVGTQSAGTTQYLAVDLEPGYYALLCFVGDPNQGGIPHTFQGMIEIVLVGV